MRGKKPSKKRRDYEEMTGNTVCRRCLFIKPVFGTAVRVKEKIKQVYVSGRKSFHHLLSSLFNLHALWSGPWLTCANSQANLQQQFLEMVAWPMGRLFPISTTKRYIKTWHTTPEEVASPWFKTFPSWELWLKYSEPLISIASLI